MKIAAIICEYNPFHNGHLIHIDQTRKMTNCDYVLCLMSGNFVQRGEPAIFDKYLRALTALNCGADIVIELPTIYSINNAEQFAYGAINMLSKIPEITHLSFGSEAGDINVLKNAANVLLNETSQYQNELAKNLSQGMAFPQARALALQSVYGIELNGVISSPNNILGIEYLRALARTSSHITPVTTRRSGQGYNDCGDSNVFIPSATALRKRMENAEWDQVALGVPNDLVNLYRNNYKPELFSRLSDITMYSLATTTLEELTDVYDVTEGLEFRIKEKSIECTDLNELLSTLKTKRYTAARLRRIVMYILLGINARIANLASAIELKYYNVLGVKKEAKHLLGLLPPYSITRIEDARKINDIGTKSLLEINERADDIYSVLSGTKKGQFYSHGMITV